MDRSPGTNCHWWRENIDFAYSSFGILLTYFRLHNSSYSGDSRWLSNFAFFFISLCVLCCPLPGKLLLTSSRKGQRFCPLISAQIKEVKVPPVKESAERICSLLLISIIGYVQLLVKWIRLNCIGPVWCNVTTGGACLIAEKTPLDKALSIGNLDINRRCKGLNHSSRPWFLWSIVLVVRLPSYCCSNIRRWIDYWVDEDVVSSNFFFIINYLVHVVAVTRVTSIATDLPRPSQRRYEQHGTVVIINGKPALKTWVTIFVNFTFHQTGNSWQSQSLTDIFKNLWMREQAVYLSDVLLLCRKVTCNAKLSAELLLMLIQPFSAQQQQTKA